METQVSAAERKNFRRNFWFFGPGTIGRDMFYALESMFLIYFFTEVLNLSNAMVTALTLVLTVMRIFDAFNDPLTGLIVDNTKTRWGKFKPGMLIGGITGGILLVLMFTDMHLEGAWLIAVYAIIYLAWDFLYGWNDIAYWSLLPALSTDQKQREKIGSFARICANIGLFAVVVGYNDATTALSNALGSPTKGWFAFAVIVACLMILFQLFTLFGVKEDRANFKEEEKTSLKEMFRVLFKNDQLMWLALAMGLFMIGYVTTTTFGTYYFKYAYGDEGMYAYFAMVLGVSQLSAIGIFPVLAKRFKRKTLYTFATILVAIGYVIFFFAPASMAFVAPAGILLFVGQAFIQILMLMFLADTIEYGQLKLKKRNESITFSVQPFINKLGGALANGIVGLTVVAAGINDAKQVSDVTAQGITLLKSAMMLIPMALIAVGFGIYLWRFKIDEKRHAEILAELRERGDIHS